MSKGLMYAKHKTGFEICTISKPGLWMSSRELASLGAPGGLTAAGTILFLSLAWSGVEAPQAMADINIPYKVFC